MQRMLWSCFELGNYRSFLHGPLPVANYMHIIIPGSSWSQLCLTKILPWLPPITFHYLDYPILNLHPLNYRGPLSDSECHLVDQYMNHGINLIHKAFAKVVGQWESQQRSWIRTWKNMIVSFLRSQDARWWGGGLTTEITLHESEIFVAIINVIFRLYNHLYTYCSLGYFNQ